MGDRGVGRLRYVADPPAAIAEHTAADLQNVAAKSWTKYAASYDEKARSQWQDEFNTDYRRFSDEALHPLARSHVAWMTSGPMRNHLDCAYDGASAEAGLVYTRVLTMCVQGTEQFEPCAELYVQWLSGAYADVNNLVLRALALNLDSLRTKLIDSVPPETAWDEIQWDGLIGAFNNAVDNVAKQTPEVLGQFLAALGGSITQALQRAADGPVRHGLVACGMVSGRPVVPVTLAGSYKAYRASLIRQLLKASGVRKMSEHAMQREVSLALRRLQIRGEPMSQSVASTFLVMIDEDAIKGMPPGLKKSEQARWLAGAIRSAEEIERLNLAAWRERIDVPDMTARAGKSLPFVGNLLAGLFQWAAYQKVSRDLASAMPDEKREHQFRLGSAVLAMGATVADTIARAAGALAETTLNYGRAARLRFVERGLRFASNMLGIIAAGINTFWDAKNAIEAASQRNYALFAARLVSAVGGFIAAGLIAGGAVVSAIVATLVCIGAGVMAKFIEDDGLTQWLKRCYWGVLGAKDRYPNSAVEMSELGVATGG